MSNIYNFVLMKLKAFQIGTLLCLMFLSWDTMGQIANIDFYQREKFGVTLSSMLNNYQGIQFNYARGFNESMDINAEFGVILKAENRESSSGFRFRIQPRFRISSDPTKYRAYISPLFQYRYTNSMVENIFSRFDGAYFQQITHREVNNMFSVGVMIGRFFRLDDAIYINWAVGLGLNVANINFPDVPDDAQWQAEFKDIFFLSSDAYDYKDKGRYGSILMIYHINLFYLFK